VEIPLSAKPSDSATAEPIVGAKGSSGSSSSSGFLGGRFASPTTREGVGRLRQRLASDTDAELAGAGDDAPAEADALPEGFFDRQAVPGASAANAMTASETAVGRARDDIGTGATRACATAQLSRW
jgi:hypothetical protein